MKTRLGMVLSVFTLMMCVGCALLKSEEERNEVLRGFSGVERGGVFVTCINQITTSTNDTVKTSDVYVMSGPFLQTYRIEGRKVFNCRWTDRLEDWDWDGFDAIQNTWPAMIETFRQLPNGLGQGDGSRNVLENGSEVTVTSMGWGPFPTPSPPDSWSHWTVQQWVGASDEVPTGIELFRQAAKLAISAPDYMKNYNSYLRAVPLFTDADYDAEKDTPVIDFKNTRYHVRNAMQYPYLLIPISGWGSPFPTAKKYTPGDKFKIRDDYYGDYYYLIETFAKGKGKKSKR